MQLTDRSFRVGFLTAIGGLALVLAACSNTGGSAAPSGGAPSAAAPSAAPASAAAGGGGAVQLATANGAVGDYITGADGKTLYIFTKDSAGKSVCVDACATK